MHVAQTITLPAMIVEQIEKHMRHLERMHALELEYPDDVEGDEARTKFDRLNDEMAFNCAGLANLLTEVMHEDRWTILCESQDHETDKRLSKANALQEIV